MADVFLCYARQDQDRAEQLGAALARSGWAVSWDHVIMPGVALDEATLRDLKEVPCVIVLWSQHSVESHRVLEVALRARERGVLIPVRIENIAQPLMFADISFGDLTQWTGRLDAREFEEIADAVKTLVLSKKPNTTPTDAPALPLDGPEFNVHHDQLPSNR